MEVKIRENYHSISITIKDEKKTSVGIKLGYYGYELKASGYPSAGADLNSILKKFNVAMSKYLGKDKAVNLCGCQNYGEFSKKIASTIEPAKTWDEASTNLYNMA